MVALERKPTRDHLVEHDAQRENIRPPVHRFASSLLRRHVGHRTQGRTELSYLRVTFQLGQAEVDYPHPAFLADQDVLGLYVSMRDPGLMSLCQTLTDLHADVDYLADAEIPRGDQIPQRFALHILHGQKQPVLKLIHLVNRDYVGMAEGRGGLRLPRESRFDAWI